MSYSYVKTVFPDFKYSNVYDVDLYKNISSTPKQEIQPINQNTINQNSINQNSIVQPSFLLETFNNNEHFQEINTLQKDFNTLNEPQSNTKYYLKPSVISDVSVRETEKFDNESGHGELKHILQCDECKNILMKQFGIESNRIRNEEILELLSFLIFGVLMLLLIDSLKN